MWPEGRSRLVVCMDHLIWYERPQLTKPVVIAAFAGWNDAADAATMAVRHLISTFDARRVATIDPEPFYKFQSTRPHVRLVDDGKREIVWPGNELYVARTSFGDALFVLGIEPQLKWRTFCQQITDLAVEHDATMALTLGALLADVHHRSNIDVIGSATDQELIDRFDLQRSRYEGPTGIIGVLSDAFGKRGIPSVSLWAATPAYAAQLSSPKAARSLVRRVAELAGAPISDQQLSRAVATYEQNVDSHVASDDDLARFVSQLHRTDSPPEPPTPEPMDADPDAFVAEVERFLRDQGGE